MQWLKPLSPRGEGSAGDNNDTQVAWLRVAKGEAQQYQITLARQVFAQHLNEISWSLAGYHTLDYRMTDGSRLRIVSNSGVHQATLWPTGEVSDYTLPHGFAVVANWGRPRIFKRRPLVDPVWAVDAVQVPQATLTAEIDAENQVFRVKPGATTFFNHPMVLLESSRALWDYLKHAGAAPGSTNPVTPINLMAGTEYKSRNVHYGIDNTIVDAAGATLYTMSLSSAISTENPQHAPACTTADGAEVVLQHFRSYVISPSTGVYIARFANERLTRTDEATYALAERNVVSVTGPIGAIGASGGASSSTLGETIGSDQFFLGYGYVKPGGVYGSGGFFTYVTMFDYEGVHDLSPHMTETEIATREEGPFSSTPTSELKTLAAPEATAVAYPPLVIDQGVGGEVKWRAGYYKKGTAWPGSISGISATAWYGKWSYRKDRIDTEYTRTTTPAIYFQLGWADFKMLEGSSLGECTGKTYTDTYIHGRSGSHWDGSILLRTYISPTATEGGYDGTPEWLAALVAADIKPEIVAFLEPAYPAMLGGPGTEVVESIADERPINVGEYTLTSRYVIDYDHKGQFWAAIQVTVACSGAEWRESGYQGNMTEWEQPTYVVEIHLETNWKGAVNRTLLASATATRKAFEFTEIIKQNPYYFLSAFDPDKQEMKVRVPPSFGLPHEAMSQIRALCTHQGANTHLVCADVRPDITGEDIARAESASGIEFSTLKDGRRIEPHTKFVTGQLYARTFKISDFPDSLWLLHSTKCDATENDAGSGPSYFYFAALKATIDGTTFRVEVRDGVHEEWSDEIAPGVTPPAFIDRETKLYRV